MKNTRALPQGWELQETGCESCGVRYNVLLEGRLLDHDLSYEQALEFVAGDGRNSEQNERPQKTQRKAMNTRIESTIICPCDRCQEAVKDGTKPPHDQNVDLLDLDDPPVETQEQAAARQDRRRKQLAERVLLRTHNFLVLPDKDKLELVLFALARYMQAKGEKVRDQFVLYTWHKATCGECEVDEDGCMEDACDRYLEYMERDRWMSPNLPVEQVRD